LFGALHIDGQEPDQKTIEPSTSKPDPESASHASTTNSKSNNSIDDKLSNSKDDKLIVTNNNNDNNTNADDKMDIDEVSIRENQRDIVVDAQLVQTPPDLVNLKAVFEGPKIETASWSPADDTIAIAESDLTAKLLSFRNTDGDYSKPSNVIKLQHPGEEGVDKSITALAWDSTGRLLVTASFDGMLRLWTSDGKLRQNLSLHRAPVLVIRWNKPNTLIMSVDCTNTVVIWDAYSGNMRQTFQHPSTTIDGVDGPTSIGTDADWIDSLTYACTGENASIIIYKTSERGPLLRFRDHTQGINTLQFEPKTHFLASGSDDHTIRIWHGKSQTPILKLLGHTGPVIWISWVPNGGNIVSELDPVCSRLVSASLDGTLRVWDPNRGLCLAVLALHEEAIFACDISKDGRYVASGGFDGVLVVWDISTIKREVDESKSFAVARYELSKDGNKEDEQINSISWNKDGSKLFVGFSSRSVIVDFKLK
jgi:transducin (beta)-like 1